MGFEKTDVIAKAIPVKIKEVLLVAIFCFVFMDH